MSGSFIRLKSLLSPDFGEEKLVASTMLKEIKPALLELDAGQQQRKAYYENYKYSVAGRLPRSGNGLPGSIDHPFCQ
jgi:hypothetical protein